VITIVECRIRAVCYLYHPSWVHVVKRGCLSSQDRALCDMARDMTMSTCAERSSSNSIFPRYTHIPPTETNGIFP
jgi:hypothetical protein